jgi:hypothetical protein
MRGFVHNCKGAVTVLVTLLLIPAILVTGTGVDLARLYTARSAVRDANQLAANSALTTYDSLLQDLYGVFAVMQSDEELAAMLDTYIRASLFGEDITEAQMGELRLFWGSEGADLSVRGFDALSNVELLRRQIEEYAKWRAPVAIIGGILDRLSSSTAQVNNDSEAISERAAIDEDLEAIIETYKNIIEKIDKIYNDYKAAEKEAFDGVNKYMNRVHEYMLDLNGARDDYEAAVESGDTDKANDAERHYKAILENIRIAIYGGGVTANTWIPGDYNDGGEWVDGAWRYTDSPPLEGLRIELPNYTEKLESFESQFNDLIELCRQADSQKAEVQNKIQNLKNKLGSMQLSDGLADGMKKDLELCEELLKYDYESLANDFKSENIESVEATVAQLSGIDRFGKVEGNSVTSPSVTFANVYRADYFPININIPAFNTGADELRNLINNVGGYTYAQPNTFRQFSAITTQGNEHREAYDSLGELTGMNPEAKEKAEKAEKGLTEAFDEILEIWDGITNYDPTPGAKHYTPNPGNKPAAFITSPVGMDLKLGLGEFGNGFWEDLNIVKDIITGDKNLSSILSGMLNDLSNRAILVTYDVNMFSYWTIDKGDNEDKSAVSMSGNPIDENINYFYKSELEYLLNGDTNASGNLQAITTTIIVIRLLANVVSSFILSEVNDEILVIQNMVSLVPFAGGVLRFLVRPLYAFAESVLDVSRLRNGYKVVLMKLDSDTWKFRIMGALEGIAEEQMENALENISGEAIQSKQNEGSDNDDDDNDEYGVYYVEYLTLFLMAQDPNTLAARTGNLIMLNVSTYRNRVEGNTSESDNTRENAMAAIKLFDLGKANTSFEITTTTNMRFMFLSLNYAQGGNWVNARPPRTFPIRQTDYRGY